MVDTIPSMRKKIDGKIYDRVKTSRLKSEANKSADFWRRRGFKVRIFSYPNNKNHKYAVYSKA